MGMEANQVLNEKKEEIKFDADINELYSKNEIFLRELLSNSSDALEKLRYESLTNKELLEVENDLKIKVWVDSNNKELIIEDTGIGMTRNDLITNLGTIARSGTKQFTQKIKNNNDIDQIGQFGVGFYSSFLVADNVKLYTKNNNDKEYVWESTSDKSYTITENINPILKRGTRIHLSIKEDQSDYLNINTVKDTIKKYTQFINFPIEIQESKEIEVDEDEDVETQNVETQNVETENVETENVETENVEICKEDEVEIEEVDEDAEENN